MRQIKPFCFCVFIVCCFFTPVECRSNENKAPAASTVIIPNGVAYPPEHIYDTRRHSDDALVNVQIESNRWPNCHTFESTIQSIFRIEGVTAKSDEEKALALWKWFRILMSATGGGYAYEGGVPGKEALVFDGHKILTVYGHHQCDGLSWAMVPLWRAAGYIAFDEASHGHTTASLRYRDKDGQHRFHSLDPQERFFWWNADLGVVGNRTLPLMQGSVHRHVTLPQKVHSLRRSLHANEAIEWTWVNEGQVVPSGRSPKDITPGAYYQYRKGKQDGIYACAGTEVQRFSADVSPEGFFSDLSESSENVTSTRLSNGGDLLHPQVAGQRAEAIYRIASAYVGVDATLSADVRRLGSGDTLKLYLSRDGNTWEMIYDKKDTGEAAIRLDLGRESRGRDRPHVYTAYTFYIKAEMLSYTDRVSVGLKTLHVTVHRMLNKRTLPNLMPGENVFKVSADFIRPGKALALSMDYQVMGKKFNAQHTISTFPYYFSIHAKYAGPEIRDNYDTAFGLGDVRMGLIGMRLVDITGEDTPRHLPLSAAQAGKKFEEAHPHPAGKRLIRKRRMKKTETDISQTDGFFPQQKSPRYPSGGDLSTHISQLTEQLRSGKDESPKSWRAAEALGNYPEAVDALLAKLPKANIDLTLFICKALAQIGDRKAIGPLLDKWKMAPEGAPGTRYIPDVLAAIGDPAVVPALASKLRHVRFDYRFHIAHALGKLGGPQAEETLLDLSQNDPFPAVRAEAKRGLSALRE